jgi:phage terminase large subunit
VPHSYWGFWRSTHRYQVLRGGRASGKSYTASLKLVYQLMRDSRNNGLVVRRFYNTLRDSCFQQVQTAIKRLGVEHLWDSSTSPLRHIYKPTGQCILYRGLDNPDSITSITVSSGFLSIIWFEEAYQIDKASYDKIDLSIRALPEDLPAQIMLTFNPWSACWLKDYWDRPSPNVFTLVTTYMDNPYLSEADNHLFEDLQQHHPRRFQIEGMGEWGRTEGLVYTDWETCPIDILALQKNPRIIECIGLDFGFSTDPTAAVRILLDPDVHILHICQSYSKHGRTNDDLVKDFTALSWNQKLFIADSASPKDIADLQRKGFQVHPAQKGPDSIAYGIRLLQSYHWKVDPKCGDVVSELSSYAYETDRSTGALLARPEDDNNHCMDAIRYACMHYASSARMIAFPGRLGL